MPYFNISSSCLLLLICFLPGCLFLLPGLLMMLILSYCSIIPLALLLLYTSWSFGVLHRCQFAPLLPGAGQLASRDCPPGWDRECSLVFLQSALHHRIPRSYTGLNSLDKLEAVTMPPLSAIKSLAWEPGQNTCSHCHPLL